MKVLLFAFVAGVTMSSVAAAAPDKVKVDPTYLPYEKPGLFAQLSNGDTIHIKCMGTGSPTVILTAGSGDWSATWREVQPQIAETTRVCSWDRPGYGFSSGSTRPQTVLNTTADLEAALKVAHIDGPYVLMSHSLGSYETLLFADHNPKAVAGMVLVDPSIPDQYRLLTEAAPAFMAWGDQFTQKELAVFDRCIAGLKSGKSKPGLPDPDGCWTYAPDYPPELTAALDKRDTNPLRFPAIKSYRANTTLDGKQVINRDRNYGDMPLIVLTSGKIGDLSGDVSQRVKDQLPAFHAEWVRAHDEIATLSSRGVNRIVPEATHYIQHDQPQAVIDAVNEVVEAVRHR